MFGGLEELAYLLLSSDYFPLVEYSHHDLRWYVEIVLGYCWRLTGLVVSLRDCFVRALGWLLVDILNLIE